MIVLCLPLITNQSRPPPSRYGTIPFSRRHHRNVRPLFSSTPSNNDHNNNFAPSIYTEMDAIENDLQSHVAAPLAPQVVVPESIPEAPEPVEEAVQSRHIDEVAMVERRPSPPSFLKHLEEELQLEEPIKQLQSPNQSFHYSKQHTGLKNLSFNVGAAVMPSGKMEFDDDEPASFGIVKINRQSKKLFPNWEPHPIIGRKKWLRLDVPHPERLMASKSAENLTDQGYLDLKFYHNKLW